ncbi:ead/Ea22-like family protein [Escherichia coli]|uniref:ead/Ea22-like family protein n=1 Tax=Escherichia coli TaxID=562 RepID=UPI000B7E29BE|nr:ead/Ea22-like family protein [Escherichia coli]
MTKINYQALREAAEKATWGDWDSYKPHRGARGYEVRLSSQAIAQHVLKNNAEFIAAFNPKIALALLDERERNQQYIKRRDQESEDIALTVGRLRVELEAAERQILRLEKLAEAESAGADKSAESCVEWMKRCHAAEKRIAELESLTAPELPQPSPVVPDEMTPKQASRSYCGEVRGYRDGWNDCRAAMLQCSEPVQEWIPCSERMPDKLIPVMVMYEDGDMWSAMWNGNRWDDGTEYPDPHSVTHWREMPAAQKQGVNRG